MLDFRGGEECDDRLEGLLEERERVEGYAALVEGDEPAGADVGDTGGEGGRGEVDGT